MRLKTLIAGLGLLGLVTGCAQVAEITKGAVTPAAEQTTPDAGAGPPKLQLIYRTYEQIDGWTADRLDDALPAFIASCNRWRILPLDRALGPDGFAGTVADWLPACEQAAALPPSDTNRARYFFESQFYPFALQDRGARAGLFTGYYEASLKGSWTRKGAYTVPILSRPSDIISINLGQWKTDWLGQQIAGRIVDQKVVPYPTRAEIEDGALAGRQLEIMYVDNPVDAFVLHIQGSGRVQMDDGAEVRIGFSGRNGHSYYAIGRELVARGILPAKDVTMPAIRQWLEASPAAGREVMRKNKSYIFFRVVTDEGPVGAMGVPLTPGRSIAVDPAFVPLGVPMFVSTPHPVLKDQRLEKLTMAQDTGSAIKGPVRADYFWGHGRDAAYAAGVMRGNGTFVMLLPKAVGEKYLPPPLN